MIYTIGLSTIVFLFSLNWVFRGYNSKLNPSQVRKGYPIEHIYIKIPKYFRPVQRQGPPENR